MALLLAFDTATSHLAVVLSNGKVPLASRTDATASLSHAEKLNIFIAEVLEETGHDMKDLSAVAVGTGPGSYTGLRIGLSAAKGLCFALGIPLIGMGTLEILVAEMQSGKSGFGPDDILFPMVDARRMEVYTRPFNGNGGSLEETAPLILDDAWCKASTTGAHTVVFGDGADKAKELWAQHPEITYIQGIRPDVHGLALCASAHFESGRSSNLATLVPEYGKPANVAQKRGAH
ncbi:MAG: tRNA (adenosine(37)-N6)-threonylcarbamoyltransferase complex dimerization subunit type 1 TsaB [Flavobacteriales bacterium]